MAHLGGEHDAGRAIPGMAGVVGGMVAWALAATRRSASRGPRATAYGRQRNFRAALTSQLFKT